MFKLVVVILCFATLLVSTGSALKKDEYEINIKHGTFAVHQRRANANSVTNNENGQQQANEQFLGEGRDRGESSADDKTVAGDGDRNLAPSKVSRKNSQQQQPKPIKSIDFEAISPGLEEVPLQESIFQSSQGYGLVRNQGPTVSYQSVEHYVNDDANEEIVAIVKPISAQDFYNTPQLRSANGERGPVLFPIEQPTTTTTTTTTMATPMRTKPPSKRLKSIPKSAILESEEIYLLLKYENARKKAAEKSRNSGMAGSPGATASATPANGPQVEVDSNGDSLSNGLRAGGSFTTVGYFVTDDPTTTMMTPGTMAASANMASEASPTEPSTSRSRGRGRPNKLRNSYGDFLNGDFRDFENSFRPVTENTQEPANNDGAAAGAVGESEDGGNQEEIDANLDIAEMTRILAGRSGGLTIQEFNRLFKDYLKKEITVDDLEEFVKYAGEEPPENETEEMTTSAPLEQDPTKSFDIRAENGKKSTKTSNGIATPAPTAKQQEQLKVQINKALAGKGLRKDKVVKIGYGGSKSFQGVYKSQKFLEKVKSERAPLLMDAGMWRGLEYRQKALPMREMGAMAYVDNPVFGFAGPRPQLGPIRGQLEMKPVIGTLHGGQSYVKFQKIS
ncbi:uncharacterized protein LOC118463573 [Anopheles albimanus]|uniref:uncharacterized protein LOC118463573 n=1 Tax=Anopheles albimanus TaxID=7167 RepID=UPI001640C5EF|nr:uncharacterized protein LOC118463573 [Anopheles albimanus]